MCLIFDTTIIMGHAGFQGSATIQGVRITKFQVAISRKQLTLEEGWFIQKMLIF